MNSEKVKLIDTIAEKIRKILSINTNNFNIREIISQLNGSLVTNPLCIDDASVKKISPNSFKIELNPSANEQRIRFSIAHELGHLFLHMKYLIDEDSWAKIESGTRHARNTNIPYTILEQEANEFAAAFLMPKDEFNKIANETSDENYYYPEKVAKEFNVSVQAAEIRGKVLGIWE